MTFAVWVVTLAACAGGAEYGEKCQRDSDCAGDLTCPATFVGPSTCTWTCDASNAYRCPEGYGCLSSREIGAIGWCVQECTTDADCPPDHACNGWYCAPQ